MPDMSAIASGFAALKALKDLTEAAIGIRDAAAFRERLIEFQAKILEAQQSLFTAQEERATLVETVSNLETEVARLKAWDAEKERYELQRFDPGVFVYSLKPEAARGEPIHELCAACYQKGKKFILQATTEIRARRRVHQCPNCKTEFAFGREASIPRPTQAISDCDPFSGR